MTKLILKLRDRKGITMTEVIVAMAMVLIITGAAISLLISSLQFDEKYKSQIYAYTACESAVNCMRYTDSTDDLNKYLPLLGFEKTEENTYVLSSNAQDVKVSIQGDTWQLMLGGEVIYETKK